MDRRNRLPFFALGRVLALALVAAASSGCGAQAAWPQPAPLAADALAAAYLLTGLVFAAAYVPKLVSMFRDARSTAISHSLVAELLWTSCRAVSLVYVVLVAHQALIALVVSLDLVGRCAVVAAVLWSRRKRVAVGAAAPAESSPARLVSLAAWRSRRAATSALNASAGRAAR